jgi:hypothetical protein
VHCFAPCVAIINYCNFLLQSQGALTSPPTSVIEINQEREKDRLGELAGPTLTQHDEHQGKEEVISPSGHGSTPEELAASATDNRVIDQPGMFEEILQH